VGSFSRFTVVCSLLCLIIGCGGGSTQAKAPDFNKLPQTVQQESLRIDRFDPFALLSILRSKKSATERNPSTTRRFCNFVRVASLRYSVRRPTPKSTTAMYVEDASTHRFPLWNGRSTFM
jgi:hypothetical protein